MILSPSCRWENWSFIACLNYLRSQSVGTKNIWLQLLRCISMVSLSTWLVCSCLWNSESKECEILLSPLENLKAVATFSGALLFYSLSSPWIGNQHWSLTSTEDKLVCSRKFKVLCWMVCLFPQSWRDHSLGWHSGLNRRFILFHECNLTEIAFLQGFPVESIILS